MKEILTSGRNTAMGMHHGESKGLKGVLWKLREVAKPLGAEAAWRETRIRVRFGIPDRVRENRVLSDLCLVPGREGPADAQGPCSGKVSRGGLEREQPREGMEHG